MKILPIFAVNPRRAFDVKRWISGLSPLVMLLAQVAAPLPGYALEFPDVGDRGAPDRTAGGGTRGGLCEGGDWMQQSINALVPTNNVHTFVGTNASLKIHLADGFEDKQAEIYVQDIRTQTAVYQEQMPLGDLNGTSDQGDDYRAERVGEGSAQGSAQGSIIQVNVPAISAEGEPLLAVNQDYFWEFAIICNPDDRTQDYIVQGLMTRVELSKELSESLAIAPAAQQAELYAEAGIWQETLAIAQALKPTDHQLWIELLDSVGLADLSESPLKDCCSL